MQTADIEKYRQKILKSATFESSQTLRDLFDYLLTCSLAKEPPKETIIAIEVFGKSADFDTSQDPIVRVTVSKLRRRLKQYYEAEGRRDKVRFEIPRGHYEIVFQPARKKLTFNSRNMIVVLSGLLVVALVTIIYLLFTPAPKGPVREISYARHIFWDDFIKANKSINVVLADQYIFLENLDSSEYVLMRNYRVNSDEELADFAQRYPNRAIQTESKFPQFDKNSIWGLQYILPVLTANPHHFFFSLSSELETEDLKTNPTIYVGSMVELRLLSSFLQHYGFTFGIYPNVIRIYHAETDSLEIINYEWDELGFHNDYAVLAKLPGPKQQPIGIFASLAYSGNYAAAKYMSDSESLTQLEDAFIAEHGYIPRYFVCIFEVRGFRRVDFDLSIYKMKPIENAPLAD
jgi:hypothetical protein